MKNLIPKMWHAFTYQYFLYFSLLRVGNEIVTTGGPKQVYISQNMNNKIDNSFFSALGINIGINWRNGRQRCRMVFTEEYLTTNGSAKGSSYCFGSGDTRNPKIGQQLSASSLEYQATDHEDANLKIGPMSIGHAIYVSKDSQRFPICQTKLMLQMC